MYKALALSAGGIKGFSQLGVLLKLEERDLLSRITKYIGTSVGSLICYLMAIEYTIKEIFFIALNTSLIQDPMEIKSIHKDYGMVEHDKIIDLIDKLSKAKLGYVPTLAQLKDRGKHFISVSINMTELKIEYLDYTNNPDLSCSKAVMMSCCIPFLFKKLEYKNNLYIDGWFGDPFPIGKIDDKETHILGINTESIIGNNDNIINYIYRIATLSIKELKRLKMNNLSDKCTIIEVSSDTGSMIDIGDDFETRIKLFCNGINSGSKFLMDSKPIKIKKE